MRNIFHRIGDAAAAFNKRSIDIPNKVYIERDGNNYEYSEQEPALLKARIDSLLDGFYGNQNMIELFTCLPEVYAPIHEIASRVADATWQLKRDWNDEVDFKNEDFNRLFSNPNPFTNIREHIYQSVCYEILTGRQLFYFFRSKLLGDGPENIFTWSNLDTAVRAKKITNVDPYRITALNEIVSYWYKNNTDGLATRFETADVLPFINFDLSRNKSYDVEFYKPLLAGAEKAIKNLIPVYEARGVIYIKRGALGFMVSKKSDETGVKSLTKLEKQQAIKDFDNTYGIVGHGKSPIGVTSIPVEFIRTAMSIAELQPFDETAADSIAIYAALRVPRHLAPTIDQSTFDNADSDMRSFYTNVIIPWAKRYAVAFTKAFNFDRRYIDINYDHVEVLQENKKEKADVAKTQGDTWLIRFKNGVCTLNDWIVSIDGVKGTVPMYDQKIFEMTPEDQETVIKLLKLQPDAQQTQPGQVVESTKKGGSNKV